MAIIKTLDILLRGRTDRLGSDLKKGSGLINRFARGVRSSISGAFGKIVGLATAAAGFLSVAKALSKVNEQFERIDALAKSADGIGATVAEMQSLKLAANLAGTEFPMVEQAVGRFAKVLGQAMGGNQAAINSLQTLGLSVNSFDGKSASESIGMVFDKIAGMGSQSEKTAAATAIFGKSAQKMMALIDGGSAGIRSAAADIDSFGGAISRVDAAQIEIANDAWTRMTALLDVVWANIATKVAPVFAALVEQFTEGAKGSEGFTSAISTGFEILLGGIDIANRAWHGFQGAITLTQTMAVGLFAVIMDGLAMIERGLISLGGSSFDFGLQNLANAANEVATELGEKTRKEFGLAFGENNFADEFQKRLQGVNERAKEISAEGDKKISAAPIKPKIDFKGIQDKAKGFLDGALSIGADFGKSLFRQPKSKDEREQSRPAALSRFSAEAQAAINQSQSPAAVIAKTHREAQRTRVNQEVALRDIGRSLATGVQGVLIKLGG